jgi:hypothetical protein
MRLPTNSAKMPTTTLLQLGLVLLVTAASCTAENTGGWAAARRVLEGNQHPPKPDPTATFSKGHGEASFDAHPSKVVGEIATSFEHGSHEHYKQEHPQFTNKGHVAHHGKFSLVVSAAKEKGEAVLQPGGPERAEFEAKLHRDLRAALQANAATMNERIDLKLAWLESWSKPGAKPVRVMAHMEADLYGATTAVQVLCRPHAARRTRGASAQAVAGGADAMRPRSSWTT